MKLRNLCAACAVWMGLLQTAFGQGFVNLDFEAVSVYGARIFDGVYAFDTTLPGWKGYYTTIETNFEGVFPYAGSNFVHLDVSGIGLVDGRIPGIYTSFFPLQGVGHSAIIQSRITLVTNGIGPADISLAQTAIIPATTESLRLVTQLGATNFGVFINGTAINLVQLSSTTNATTWGADIHTWANQEAELRFTVFNKGPPVNNIHTLFLDDIQFSSTAVPEPRAIWLVGIGCLALMFFRRTSRSFPH